MHLTSRMLHTSDPRAVGRMPLTICSLERAVRSSQDVQLLEGLDRWEGKRRRQGVLLQHTARGA